MKCFLFSYFYILFIKTIHSQLFEVLENQNDLKKVENTPFTINIKQQLQKHKPTEMRFKQASHYQLNDYDNDNGSGGDNSGSGNGGGNNDDDRMKQQAYKGIMRPLSSQAPNMIRNGEQDYKEDAQCIEFEKDDVVSFDSGQAMTAEQLGELLQLAKLMEIKCGDDLTSCYFIQNDQISTKLHQLQDDIDSITQDIHSLHDHYNQILTIYKHTQKTNTQKHSIYLEQQPIQQQQPIEQQPIQQQAIQPQYQTIQQQQQPIQQYQQQPIQQQQYQPLQQQYQVGQQYQQPTNQNQQQILGSVQKQPDEIDRLVDDIVNGKSVQLSEHLTLRGDNDGVPGLVRN